LNHIETLRHFFPDAKAKDFTDDRLEILLGIIGNGERRYWDELEKRMGEHIISAIDTTTGSVYHLDDKDRGRKYALFRY